MAGIIQINAVVCVIVSSIWVGIGIDPKKRSSWLLGLYAFISGFLVGSLRNDGAGGYKVITDITSNLEMGVLFAFIFMVGGVVTRWQRSKAEKHMDLAEESSQGKLANLAVNLFKEKPNKRSSKFKK